MITKEILLNPFMELWFGVMHVLPRLLIALAIFFIGWFVAKVVYRAIVKFSRTLKLDELTKPLAGAFERAGYKLDIGKIIAFLLKWFVIVGTTIISLEILDLAGIANLLKGIVTHTIPQVIVAVIILVAGITLADFVKKLVKGSTKMLNVRSAGLLANIARVAIIVFTTLVALDILGVDALIINALLMGVIGMLALAGGLAFGLGGQKAAAEFIEDTKETMHK